jgi:hypothetical protein
MRMGVSPETLPGLARPGAVRRTDIVAAGIEPAAFAAPGESDDSAGWPAFGAIVERRPGTRDCNSALGDGWDERASRIP